MRLTVPYFHFYKANDEDGEEYCLEKHTRPILELTKWNILSFMVKHIPLILALILVLAFLLFYFINDADNRYQHTNNSNKKTY